MDKIDKIIDFLAGASRIVWDRLESQIFPQLDRQWARNLRKSKEIHQQPMKIGHEEDGEHLLG